MSKPSAASILTRAIACEIGKRNKKNDISLSDYIVYEIFCLSQYTYLRMSVGGSTVKETSLSRKHTLLVPFKAHYFISVSRKSQDREHRAMSTQKTY